jgi:hypothetical protein
MLQNPSTQDASYILNVCGKTNSNGQKLCASHIGSSTHGKQVQIYQARRPHTSSVVELPPPPNFLDKQAHVKWELIYQYMSASNIINCSKSD